MADQEPYPERPPPTIDPTTLTIQLIDRELKSLRELLGTEVQHIRELFEDRIAHAEEARSVALVGVKEANDKLEVRFSKQIEDMGNLFTSKIENINKRLDDTFMASKEREGRSQGVGMTLGGLVQIVTTVVAIVSVVALWLSHAK